jgi:general secretion pathway protein C
MTQVYKLSIGPAFTPPRSRNIQYSGQQRNITFEEYKTSIVNSGFFKVSQAMEGPDVGAAGPTANISDLQLLGTISGPVNIARALIKKKTENDSKVYKLRDTIDGFVLVRILSSKVHLRLGRDLLILDMFADTNAGSDAQPIKASSEAAKGVVKKSLSRSFLQQKVLKKVDNALRGLRAGPYREDGQVKGYKLFQLRPYNILYKLGARKGDIIKRVNGHPIDSTEKLYKLWGAIQGESRIVIDLERDRNVMTYDFNITD